MVSKEKVVDITLYDLAYVVREVKRLRNQIEIMSAVDHRTERMIIAMTGGKLLDLSPPGKGYSHDYL